MTSKLANTCSTNNLEGEEISCPTVSADLVIFDCDGVLVDSEAITIEVESQLLTHAGFAISADEIAERYVGLSYASMMAGLEAQFGRPVPDGLSDQIQTEVLAAFPQQLEPVAGVADLLAGLDRPRCVASSSDLDRVESDGRSVTSNSRVSLDLVGVSPVVPASTIQ